MISYFFSYIQTLAMMTVKPCRNTFEQFKETMARINKSTQLCDEPLHGIIEKYFDNNWELYFKGVEEYYRLRINDESELNYDDYFTLDYVIYFVRCETDHNVNKYIDDNQIVENWIVANKIPDEYKHYVWDIYNDYLNDLY